MFGLTKHWSGRSFTSFTLIADISNDNNEECQKLLFSWHTVPLLLGCHLSGLGSSSPFSFCFDFSLCLK